MGGVSLFKFPIWEKRGRVERKGMVETGLEQTRTDIGGRGRQLLSVKD